MRNHGKEIFYSILVVSCAEQFNTSLRQSLPEGMFLSVDYKKNGAAARRQILEREYDIIIVNVPLPDENGLELAIDLAGKRNSSVMVAVPAEIYDMVLDYTADLGILALSKPTSSGRLEKALRMLMAFQTQIRMLELEIEGYRTRIEDLRLISKAKFLLMEQKHMTEEESHRYIGKQAMDHGISRRRAAELILDELD